MSNIQAVAEFSGLQIQIHDINGQRWIQALDIGRALGYSEPKKIMTVYQRHIDEFTDQDSCILNLRTNPQGGNPNVRVFSKSGAVTLSMFANTQRAKDFRAWAKRVLVAAMDNTATPSAPAPVAAPSSIEHHLAEISRHMASLTAVSAQQARKLEVTGRYISLLELNQRGSVKVTPALAAEVHSLSGQGMPQADIARLLRVSSSTVCRLIKGTYPATQAMPGRSAVMTPLSVETALEQAIASEAAHLTGGAR